MLLACVSVCVRSMCIFTKKYCKLNLQHCKISIFPFREWIQRFTCMSNQHSPSCCRKILHSEWCHKSSIARTIYRGTLCRSGVACNRIWSRRRRRIGREQLKKLPEKWRNIKCTHRVDFKCCRNQACSHSGNRAEARYSLWLVGEILDEPRAIPSYMHLCQSSPTIHSLLNWLLHCPKS